MQKVSPKISKRASFGFFIGGFILSTLLSMSVRANCLPVSGEIDRLSVDFSCQVKKFKDIRFSSLNFIGLPGTCFKTDVQVVIDGKKVVGKAYSGLTKNNEGLFTAGTMLILANYKTNGESSIYSTDVIHNMKNPGKTKEDLTILGGAKDFQGASGMIKINGNAIFENTTMSGSICFN